MSIIIRLQHLPWTANAMDIRRFFFGLQIPDGGVHIVGGDNGDAFIAFSSDEDARKAMLLDGKEILDTTVKLLLSSKSEMQTVIQVARQKSESEPSATDRSTRVQPGSKLSGGPNYPPPQMSGVPNYPPPQMSGVPNYPPPQKSGGPAYPPPQKSGGPTYPPPQKSGGPTYPPQKSGGPNYPNAADPNDWSSPASNISRQTGRFEGSSYDQNQFIPNQGIQQNNQDRGPSPSKPGFQGQNRAPSGWGPDLASDNQGHDFQKQWQSNFGGPNSSSRVSTPNSQSRSSPQISPATQSRTVPPTSVTFDPWQPPPALLQTQPNSTRNPYQTDSFHAQASKFPADSSQNTVRPAAPGPRFPDSTLHRPPGAPGQSPRFPNVAQNRHPGQDPQFQSPSALNQPDVHSRDHAAGPYGGDKFGSNESRVPFQRTSGPPPLDMQSLRNPPPPPSLLGDHPIQHKRTPQHPDSNARDSPVADFRNRNKPSRFSDVENSSTQDPQVAMESGMGYAEKGQDNRDYDRRSEGKKKVIGADRIVQHDEAVFSSSDNNRAFRNDRTPGQFPRGPGPADVNFRDHQGHGKRETRELPKPLMDPLENVGVSERGDNQGQHDWHNPNDGNWQHTDHANDMQDNFRERQNEDRQGNFNRRDYERDQQRHHERNVSRDSTPSNQGGRNRPVTGILKKPTVADQGQGTNRPPTSRAGQPNEFNRSQADQEVARDNWNHPSNQNLPPGDRPQDLRHLDDNRSVPNRFSDGHRAPHDDHLIPPPGRQQGGIMGQFNPGDQSNRSNLPPFNQGANNNRGPREEMRGPPGADSFTGPPNQPGMTDTNMRGSPHITQGPPRPRIPPGPPPGHQSLGPPPGMDENFRGPPNEQSLTGGPFDPNIGGPPDNRRGPPGFGPADQEPNFGSTRYDGNRAQPPSDRRRFDKDARMGKPQGDIRMQQDFIDPLDEEFDPNLGEGQMDRGGLTEHFQHQRDTGMGQYDDFRRPPSGNNEFMERSYGQQGHGDFQRSHVEKPRGGLLPTPPKSLLPPPPAPLDYPVDSEIDPQDYGMEDDQGFGNMGDTRRVVERDQPGFRDRQTGFRDYQPQPDNVKRGLLETPDVESSGPMAKPGSLLGAYPGSMKENTQGRPQQQGFQGNMQMQGSNKSSADMDMMPENEGGQSFENIPDVYRFCANLPTKIAYRDIRRFFKGCIIPATGLKLINDDVGNRNGEAFVMFNTEMDAARAMEFNGQRLYDRTVAVMPTTKERFEIAIDSFHPEKEPALMGATSDDIAKASLLLKNPDLNLQSEQNMFNQDNFENRSPGNQEWQDQSRDRLPIRQSENRGHDLSRSDRSRTPDQRKRKESERDRIRLRNSPRSSRDRQIESEDRTRDRKRSPVRGHGGRHGHLHSSSSGSPSFGKRSRSPLVTSKRSRSNSPKEYYLVMKDLPRNVIRQDIRDMLRGLKIARNGDAIHIEVNLRGVSNGCALVEMASARDLDDGLKRHSRRIRGSAIRIYDINKKEYNERIERSRENDKKNRPASKRDVTDKAQKEDSKPKGQSEKSKENIKDDGRPKDKTSPKEVRTDNVNSEMKNVKAEELKKDNAISTGNQDNKTKAPEKASAEGSEKPKPVALKRKMLTEDTTAGTKKSNMEEQKENKEAELNVENLVKNIKAEVMAAKEEEEQKLSWAEEVAKEEAAEMEADSPPLRLEFCAMLNGLPQNCNEAKVRFLFKDIKVQQNGVHLIKCSPDGVHETGFVEFFTSAELGKALERGKLMMDNRYISITPLMKQDLLKKKAEVLDSCIKQAESHAKTPNVPSPRAPLLKSPLISTRPIAQTPLVPTPGVPPIAAPGCAIRAGNLPFRATLQDIATIFSEYSPNFDEIRIRYAPDGRPTGDALIPFFNPRDAQQAYMSLNNQQTLGRRLFLSVV